MVILHKTNNNNNNKDSNSINNSNKWMAICIIWEIKINIWTVQVLEILMVKFIIKWMIIIQINKDLIVFQWGILTTGKKIIE